MKFKNIVAINQVDIQMFEKNYRVQLPQEYVDFLLKNNAATPDGIHK